MGDSPKDRTVKFQQSNVARHSLIESLLIFPARSLHLYAIGNLPASHVGVLKGDLEGTKDSILTSQAPRREPGTVPGTSTERVDCLLGRRLDGSDLGEATMMYIDHNMSVYSCRSCWYIYIYVIYMHTSWQMDSSDVYIYCIYIYIYEH